MIKRSIVLGILFIGLANAMEQRAINSLSGKFSLSESENLEDMKYLLGIILSDDIKSKTAEEILLETKTDSCLSIEDIFGSYLQPTKCKLPSVKIPYVGCDGHTSNFKRPFLLQTKKELLKLEQQEHVLQEVRKRKAIILDEDNALKSIDVLHVNHEDAEMPSLQSNKTVLVSSNDNVKKLSVSLAKANTAKKRKICRRTAPFFSDEHDKGSHSEYIDSVDESIIDEIEEKLDTHEKDNSEALPKTKKRKPKLNKGYICTICDIQIHMNYKQAHELWHAKTAKYSCEPCKMSSNDPLFLIKHLKTQNHYKLSGQSIAKKMKFNCTVEDCKKRCISKRALHQHCVRKHPHSESIITCPNCIFTAVNQSVMNDHIQNVNHGKNWICKSCSLDTGSRGALLQHARVHEETQCDKCNYKAEFPVKLLKHYREDKHGLDLSCEVCDEKHSNLKALNQHRYVDHQIKKLRRK